MDFDDFDLLDDWSETADGDASDTWDEADEDFGYGAGLAAAEEDGDEDEDAEGEWDGAIAVDVAAPGQPVGGGMSAWELGTATAVAGWLLDRQADQIVAAIQRQGAAAGPAPGPAAPGAPAWRRLPDLAVDPRATPLVPGDRLERSRLAATITVRLAGRQQLGLEARPRSDAPQRSADPSLDPRQVLFTVVVSELTPSAPVWVMFEERAGGFATARLQPVFDGTGPPGRAYCFVDAAVPAVQVIEWGLGRYGLDLSDFTWSGGF